MKTFQELKAEIIEYIDWNKILKVTQALNWTYHDKPEMTIGALMNMATFVMDEAYNNGEGGYCLCGGFEAHYSKKNNELSLKFVVEQFEAGEEDDEDKEEEG